jgi:hypothetical protein
VIDGYSAELLWQRPQLGVFKLAEGANFLEIQTLEPHPDARPYNLFGLDYIFLVKQPKKESRPSPGPGTEAY